MYKADEATLTATQSLYATIPHNGYGVTAPLGNAFYTHFGGVWEPELAQKLVFIPTYQLKSQIYWAAKVIIVFSPISESLPSPLFSPRPDDGITE